MADLVQQLLAQIEAGHSEDALRTVELLTARSSDPAVCNQQTLDALQRAHNLAVIQQSHLRRRLQSLSARRLFHQHVEPISATWQIDG